VTERDSALSERAIMGRHAAHWQPYLDRGEMVVFGQERSVRLA